MEWDEPAPTITTQFYNYGSGRFGHPEQDRALTLREGAMLQTFPEDYTFVDPDDEVHLKRIGRLVGNAVPVELAKSIGNTITQHLERNDVTPTTAR
jgi:DNA (cytosine-5)-methyltransferase 1